jgi:hypothetical protein
MPGAARDRNKRYFSVRRPGVPLRPGEGTQRQIDPLRGIGFEITRIFSPLHGDHSSGSPVIQRISLDRVRMQSNPYPHPADEQRKPPDACS